MSNKNSTRAELNKLTIDAISRTAPFNIPELIDLHNAAMFDLHGTAFGASPAPTKFNGKTIIEIAGERDRLRAECIALNELVAKQISITLKANAQVAALTAELAEARATTAQFATTELAADETPALILAELRKQTVQAESVRRECLDELSLDAILKQTIAAALARCDTGDEYAAQTELHVLNSAILTAKALKAGRAEFNKVAS